MRGRFQYMSQIALHDIPYKPYIFHKPYIYIPDWIPDEPYIFQTSIMRGRFYVKVCIPYKPYTDLAATKLDEISPRKSDVQMGSLYTAIIGVGVKLTLGQTDRNKKRSGRSDSTANRTMRENDLRQNIGWLTVRVNYRIHWSVINIQGWNLMTWWNSSETNEHFAESCLSKSRSSATAGCENVVKWNGTIEVVEIVWKMFWWLF